MPSRSSRSKPYERGKGPDGLETHFSKCPFCARKILVQIGLFGVSHNLGVTAVCADCIRDKGLDPKYRAEDPSTARQIEAWAKARPRLRGPPAEVVVREMRDGRSRGISRRRVVLSDKVEPEDPVFTRPPAAPRTGQREKTSVEHDKLLYDEGS